LPRPLSRPKRTTGARLDHGRRRRRSFRHRHLFARRCAVRLGLTWTLVLTFPLMAAIQLVSAHIGRVTGRGLAYNMAKIMPRWLVISLVTLLFIANTINVGADMSAMGAAAELVFGWGQHTFTIVFAAVSLLLQMFISYQKYARFLMVLTLSLFSYVALVFSLHVDWPAVGLSV